MSEGNNIEGGRGNSKMINWIGKVYKWIYGDILQRREPFTRQISRIAQAHPVLYYSGIGWVIGFLVAGLVFLGWLIWHIKDYIKRHPENKPL